MGSAVILDIHLQVEPFISVSEGHHIGDWVCYQLKKKFKEISDITVHIDAEDDEEGIPVSIPPLRNEVRTELMKSWQGLLAEEDIYKMTLHYLESRINIELFLNQKPRDDSDELHTKLTELAKHLPWLGEISLWSG
jgi:ribosome recycling factor